MFEVFKSPNDGKYYFRLKAQNGEIVLSSQGYTEKKGCLRGIKSVKRHATDAVRFEQRTATDGQFFFVLKSANSRVIGTSQMYAGQDGAKAGIEAVMRCAPESQMVITT